MLARYELKQTKKKKNEEKEHESEIKRQYTKNNQLTIDTSNGQKSEWEINI